MKIAVFGGTGRTGILAIHKALEEGYEVTALARTPEKMTIQDEKLTVIQGDVADKQAVANTVAGTDAIISSISPMLVGVQNIIDAAKDAGIRRLVVTSGAGVVRSGDEPTFSSKIISWLIKTFSKEAYEESFAIADTLAETGLDWTLVRAPRLTDQPATGSLYIGPLNKNMKTSLSREDYANFLVATLKDDSMVGQTPVVSNK